MGAKQMLWVVDKKVIKHTIDAGQTLVEVPIRISFEYALQGEEFVGGSLKREYLFNRQELVRRFPQLDTDQLDSDIAGVVDRALIEHLKFAGYASGDVELTAPQDGDEAKSASTDNVDRPPGIVMPDSRGDD